MSYETTLTIISGKANLSATLCLPEKEGVFPTVIMVHGSGALDRNGNAKGFKLNTFKVFAKHLAKQGIASLRYDKRGVAKSTGDFYRTGHFDLLDDAMQCLEALVKHPQCDQKALFLLGYSEGSIIVPRMSQKNSNVAGIILLNPFIENIESVLNWQAAGMKQAASELSGFKGLLIKFIFKMFDPIKMQQNFITKIKRSQKEVVYTIVRKVPAKWLRELLSIFPAEIYADTKCDCIIIGGAKDVQCKPDDVAKISKTVAGEAEYHVIPNLSHLLRLEQNNPSVFNYRKSLKTPIEPKVLELVSEWLLRKARY